MTKKRSVGRPKTGRRGVQVGYRYSEETLEILQSLTEDLRGESPSYLALSQRAVMEALIHRAKRQRDAGELPWIDLFGVPAAK